MGFIGLFWLMSDGVSSTVTQNMDDVSRRSAPRKGGSAELWRVFHQAGGLAITHLAVTAMLSLLARLIAKHARFAVV